MRLHTSTYKNFGFALVATVSMMVLLTLVAIAMLSLSTIEQRSSGGSANEADRMARANARMALMIAIGELQEAAGPDQRVTATASILGNSANGRVHWAGVWDTSNYSPADPDNKTFVRWLVSGQDTVEDDGDKVDLENMDVADDNPDAGDVMIFEGLDDAATVKVPKVEVATTSGNTSYYAYWVEDEGVKTDMNWYETPTKNGGAERAQARRLSAMPAPNYWLTNKGGDLGPFRDPNDDGSTADAIANNLGSPDDFPFDDMEKAMSLDDMALVAGGTAAHRQWLKGVRHSMSYNTRGVLADVKKGGLRRDLSLAFEMDGDADITATEQPTLFNQQVGEFVGGTDKNASPYDYPAASGLPRARYLFRETRETGGPFANKIYEKTTWVEGSPQTERRKQSVARGPTWWNLRDYYNLYKRLAIDPEADFDEETVTESVSTGSDFVDITYPAKSSGGNFGFLDIGSIKVLGSSDAEVLSNRDDGVSMRVFLNQTATSADPIQVEVTFRSSTPYILKARAYYPDRSTIGYDHGEMLDTITTWADHRDTDYRYPHQGKFKDQWKYVFRPARPNYAPVFLGTTVIISITGDNYDATDQTAEITLTLDPIFYFWNPYNRKVEVDNLMVHFDVGLSGTVNIEVTTGGSTTTYSPDLWELLSCNFFNYHGRGGYPNYGFLINESADTGTSPFVLEPGEVLAASPSSNTGQSYLGYDPLNNASGIFMSSVDVGAYNSYWADPAPWRNKQVRASVAPGATSINVGYHNPTGSGGQSVRHYMDSSLAPAGTTPSIFQTTSSVPGNQLQHTHMQLTSLRHEYRNPQTIVWPVPKDFNTLVNFDGDTGDFIGGVKQQFGLFTYLMKPANWSGLGPNAAEIFSRFNPAPMVINKDWWAAATPNMLFNFIADGTPNNLVSNYGLNFSTSERNAFWGKSYDSTGQTSVPMSNIPSSPLISLVDFGHATLGTMAEDAFHSVGNSLPSAVISPIAPFGRVQTGGGEQTYGTGTDLSWLMNDALFDRYFLSGIAPEYTIETSGYNATGTISGALGDFYSSNYKTAQASPVLAPYIPAGKTAADIVSELSSTSGDGYKKVAAYSMLKGGFNINCTDAGAWGRFLRGVNNNLPIKFTDGTIDERSLLGSTYAGFPSSSSPTPPIIGEENSRDQTWSGYSRLVLSKEINNLAANLANEVKKRGPFMSVSDFVNRRVAGDTNLNGVVDDNDITNEHYKGAIQAAIDTMVVSNKQDKADYDRDNDVSEQLTMPFNWHIGAEAGGVYSDYSKHSPLVPSTTQDTNTATGVPGSVTQADVLRVLAPRLSARSDTFRIRAYGEVRDADDKIIASAMCEALVQRIPEYVDDSDEPWDEGSDLSTTNQKYGRRFEIRSFRWLDDDEI